MKVTITRIEKLKISGKSKTGNDYSIDRTNVVYQVPYDDVNGFGFKEVSYEYGDSSNFDSLKHLHGKLPVAANIELGNGINSYGDPIIVIISVDVPSVSIQTGK